MQTDCVGAIGETSPESGLCQALRDHHKTGVGSGSRSRTRTLRSLTRLMQQHREKERYLLFSFTRKHVFFKYILKHLCILFHFHND